MNADMIIIQDFISKIFDFIKIEFNLLGYGISILNIIYFMLAIYVLKVLYSLVKVYTKGTNANGNMD